MSHPRRIVSLSFSVILLSVLTLGQNDGDPTFSTIEGHGVDAINLQNLGILLNLTVREKAGAFPFTYALIGNSSCDLYIASNHRFADCGIGITKGSPSGSNHNLSSSPGALLNGTYFYKVSYGNGPVSATCPDGSTTSKYSNWYIQEPNLTTHLLPVSDYIDRKSDGTSCLNNSFSDYAIDASGLGASVTSPTTATLHDSGGHTVGKDANGNTVSATFVSPNTIYTDTLNTVALTVTLPIGSAGGIYRWTDVNGGSPAITETLTSATIKTAFTCGLLAEDILPYTEPMLTSINYPDGSNIQFGYEPTPGGGGYTGRLQTIILRTGGTITYGYSGGNNGLDCHKLVPPTMTRTTQDGTTTYNWVSINSGLGNTTTVIDPGNNKTVYTFSGIFLTEVQKYQNTGSVSSPSYTLLSTDITCYNGASSPSTCPTASVSYPITERDIYHTVGTMSTSSRTQIRYDGVGNATFVAKYDFGATNYAVQTTTYYGSWNGSACVAIGNFIDNRPCNIWTSDGTNTISNALFSYDSHGNLTGKSVWTGSTWLGSSATYNSNGTVATSTDLNGLQTTYTYAPTGSGGCNSLLLTGAQTIVSSGDTLIRSNTWDAACNGAVVLTSTDANGNSVTSVYNDPFYRLSSTSDPLGYTKTLSYSPNSVSSNASFNSSVDNTISYLDSLGRPILAQKQEGPGSSNYDSVSTSYGWNGTMFQTGKSMPCVQTKGVACSLYYAYSTIDPLGRSLSAQDAGGDTVTNTYSQNDMKTSIAPAPAGENTKSVQTEYDGLGRPKSTCQILASGGNSCGQGTTASGYLTSYAYSTLAGGSKRIATRGVQTRTTVFDALGRVILQTNPESGTVNNVYDTESSCGPNGAYSSNGDLLKRTDARGITSCFYYDTLHRVTDIGNSAQSTINPCKRFRYDNSTGVLGVIPSGITLTNTMGKMVEAETDTCVSPITQASVITDEWFSYAKDGRLTDVWELTPHSEGYYHTSVSYYPNGSVSSLNGIPGYAAFNYSVDGEGRSSGASQSTTTIISNVAFNAASQPLTVGVYTLGDNDTYTYDPATGRMQTYKFTVNGVSDAGTLTWNNNGTLKQLAIVDGFNSGGTQTCTFGYDDLARLTSDNCGAVWSQTFSYDQYGNLTKSGSITWAPGYNSANNEYSSIGATYDLAGNLTYDSFNSYRWDASGKMSSARSGTSPATCGTSGTCVTYDANGRPVEKNVAGAYSEILYSPMGETAIMNGASTVTQSYIPLPGALAMVATGAGGTGTRRIEHRDWLGTGRLSTTLSNRTIVYDRAFAPYGEMYANFGTTSYLDFTGDKQDVFAGLFDTPNRELSPTQGRWISPDPAGAGWNRYAYVSGAPLNLIDPTGLANVLLIGGSPRASGHPFQQRRAHRIFKGFGGSGTGWGPFYIVNGAEVPSWVGEQVLSSGVGEQCPNNQCQPWSPPPSEAALLQEPDLIPEVPENRNGDIDPNAEAEEALEPLQPEDVISETWRYNLLDPGPLPDSEARNFAGGQYSMETAGEDGISFDTPLWRVSDNPDPTAQGSRGTYYSIVPQVGGTQSAIDLAVNPNWGAAGTPGGNPYSNGLGLSNAACVYLQPGTTYAIGPIASQGGAWVGGGIQIYVPPGQAPPHP
jgi:RHS repeat-associated protein